MIFIFGVPLMQELIVLKVWSIHKPVYCVLVELHWK